MPSIAQIAVHLLVHRRITNRSGLRKRIAYSFGLLFLLATAWPNGTRGADTPAPSPAQLADGCQEIGGGMQICWGRKLLAKEPRAPHTARFTFTFSKEFASVPVVSQAINVNGRGHAMGVFQWKLDTKEYSGLLNNMYIGKAVDGEITMSYIAIGAKKPD
jgi:hypothetical protein